MVLIWTKLAEEILPGRQPQIERVTQILGRRTKNNPCLIGEPGVGKTAIAEGLAQRIATGDVPETIEGKKVITLDMGLLVAGTKYRGEFEERLKKLMEEIKQSDEIILFIDEVHTLIGAGAAEGAIDAANILKPALARGELQCIGATTLDEYRKHIEKDPALREDSERPERAYEIHQVSSTLMNHWLPQLSYRIIISVIAFCLTKAIDLHWRSWFFVFDFAMLSLYTQLPEEARELEKELRQITKEKNEAVRGQDFEKMIYSISFILEFMRTGELRIETDLKAQISALVDKTKMSKAESQLMISTCDSESDIQHIVSS
ncbi:hypothetical protein Leryth_025210 [Lithospermum erythrorhizon]|nr:hypothetical protein Leryth_025210 [Lithospermum erythrorhizon]